MKTKIKIKIHTISIWNIFATILATMLFVGFYYQCKKDFNIYHIATDQYFICKDAAMELQEGSDYLTEQVRLYALTGKSQYIEAYFNEVNEIKRRENALNTLKQYFDKTESFISLSKALESSQELMQTEYYSMKLIADTKVSENISLPPEIKNTPFEAEDINLTDTDKLLKAQRLISDENYQSVKESISNQVSNCTNDLLLNLKKYENNSADVFSDNYQLLIFGIIPLVILMLGNCIVINRFVVAPLSKYNDCILKGKNLPIKGVAELQNLADIYNNVHNENEQTQAQLRFQAGHDALTKLLNRGAFEEILAQHEKSNEKFALIILDVDFFKVVNDTYGHAAGDEALKKVANALKKEFRNVDYVCRIGGDEFAVIVSEVEKIKPETIMERMLSVNQKLQEKDNTAPSVSLSIGLAFSENNKNGENIFKNADDALYYVKQNGKNGCAFYKNKDNCQLYKKIN